MKKQIKKYVLGIAISEDGNDIVLIKKNRPEWQKGNYNGIGGKLEMLDSSLNDAMTREFEEETGVKTPFSEWQHFATMIFKSDIMGGEAYVYCFKLKSNEIYQCKTITDEIVEIFKIDEIPEKNLAPNLLTLISLAKSEFSFTELVSK